MPRTGCCVIQLPVVVVRRRVVTNKRQGRSLQAGPTDFCRIQQAPNGFMLRNPLRKTLLIVFYTAWKANFRWKSILSIRYTMTSIFTRLRLSFINSQNCDVDIWFNIYRCRREYLFRVRQTMGINRNSGHNVSVIFLLPVAGSAVAAGIERYWWLRDCRIEPGPGGVRGAPLLSSRSMLGVTTIGC